MYLKLGSYTGDAASDRAIPVGFQPDVLFIKGVKTQDSDGSVVDLTEMVLKTASMSGKTCCQLAALDNAAFSGVNLTSIGFTVDDATATYNSVAEHVLNGSESGYTYTYYWAAMKDNGDGDLAWGTYTGNGTDSPLRQIATPFKPDIVVIKGLGTVVSQGIWKTDREAAGDTMHFSSPNNLNPASPNRLIYDFQGSPNCFEVGGGNKANSSGASYFWVALKKVSGRLETGHYTGTGSARTISLGFQPSMVWVKCYSDTTQRYGILQMNQSPSLGSLKFSGEPATDTSAVTGYVSDGFTLGASNTVNRGAPNVRDYTWAAFKENLPLSGSSQGGYLCGANPSLTGGQSAYLAGPSSIVGSQAAYANGNALFVTLSQAGQAWGAAPSAASQPGYANGAPTDGNASGQQTAHAKGYDPYGHGLTAQAPAVAPCADRLTAQAPAHLGAVAGISFSQTAYVNPERTDSEEAQPACLAGVDRQVRTSPAYACGKEVLSLAKTAFARGANQAAGGVGAYMNATANMVDAILPAFLSGGWSVTGPVAACVVAALPQGRMAFQLGPRQLVFSAGRVYPVQEPRERLQVVSRTAGGTIRVADKGVMVRTIRLSFRNLRGSDHAALLSWYEDVAVGAFNAFTFTDELGVSSQVRWTNSLDFQETASDRFGGEIVLERVD